MRSSHSLGRLDTAFDDDRLVADAGAPPAGHPRPASRPARARRDAPRPRRQIGRANVSDKLLTLVMSALAGGDCIENAQALRTDGTGRALGFDVKAASTLGTFLRSFCWGHAPQLDRVSRELLARA